MAGSVLRWIASLMGDDRVLLRRITKNFSIGFVGSTIILAAGLARTAVLTKSLDLADFGRILVVLNLFAVLATFLSVRVNDLLFRFFPTFAEEDETDALRDLLILALALSGGLGLVLGGGVFLGASWIADRFYQDPAFTPLFQIYSVAAVFAAFEGFFTALLRLKDRFARIVIPQVLGAVISLGLLLFYLLGRSSYQLEIVVGIIGIGTVVSVLPPLFLALRMVRPELSRTTDSRLFSSLTKHRHILFATIMQTNITGYLKLGADMGGMFLLGVLAGPTQVALYGVAQQLVRVFQVLQNNVQTAMTPEIVSLWARRKVKQLYQMVLRFTKISLVVGAIAVIIAVFLARPVILIFATPDYLEALPIFYVAAVTVYFSFVSLVYYPIALSMDELKRRNLVVSIRFIYLGIAVAIGLTAFNLAIALLVGVVTTRLFNDIPLLRQLRGLARCQPRNPQTFLAS
jgi:O-antigen/teichoic acid export membrane protein